MTRPKENVLARLKEQMGFLRTSLCAFYGGNFAESVRIATIIRTLVHESGRSKPLLKQVQPNGLDLPILDHVGEWPGEKAIFRFAVSVRMGATIAPAVDLASTHYKPSTIGAWWNEEVFTFQSQLGSWSTHDTRLFSYSPTKKVGRMWMSMRTPTMLGCSPIRRSHSPAMDFQSRLPISLDF